MIRELQEDTTDENGGGDHLSFEANPREIIIIVHVRVYEWLSKESSYWNKNK